MEYMMKFSKLWIFGLLASISASKVTGSTTTGPENMLIKSSVIGMGVAGKDITNAQYDALFRQGSAVKGVAAVLAVGQFTINGYELPSERNALIRDSAGTYKVNQVPWLFYNEGTGKWQGGYQGEVSTGSYPDAALAVVKGLVAGTVVRFYDTDY
ncbi:hypothetical protein ACFFJN_07380 [Erwinia mallotivora]|uniref:hypothetical protein n=1 Tax=Erwinia mallotivora TaxID=69222 RepID=UPI0035EFCC48